MSGGSCRDLRHLQENQDVANAFGKLISGRSGYKPVIEKSKPVVRCSGCGMILNGDEKFCPECGTKTNFGQKA